MTKIKLISHFILILQKKTMSTPKVIVYAEATPNPASMKFVANRLIIHADTPVEYLNAAAATGSPLALELFKGNYVKSLYFFNNFVTITKTDVADWSKLTQAIREFLQDYLSNNLPVIETYPEIEPLTQSTLPQATILPGSIEESIQDVLDQYVKPAVEQDGGAILFRSFDEGVVTVSLKGSCSGCPSATVTLKAGIENLLVRMVPGVREVVAEEV